MALSITFTSTDRVGNCDLATLNIVDNVNDQPNVCTVECFGFTPTMGQTLTVSLGGGDTVFAGYIVRLSRGVKKLNARVVYRVFAIDASYNADNYLATGNWSSLTTAFANIFAGTEGTTAPASAIFSAGMEDVMACASRLAAQYGGWFDISRASTTLSASLYLNANTASAGPNIGSTDTDWWDLEWTEDATQVRDKVYATYNPITLLAWENATAPVSVADYNLVTSNMTCLMNDCDLVTLNTSQTPVNNTPAFPVVATAATAGATSITVGSMSSQGNTNWWLVNGQYIYGTWANATTLSSIPATGSGSIIADIPVGAILEPQYSVAITNSANEPTIPATCVPYTSYGSGTHLRRIGSFNTAAEALAAATTEHGRWNASEVRGRVMTTDTSAYAGNSIAVTVGGLNATYRIERVTMTWDIAKGKFVRAVEFATQKRDLISVLLSK